MNAFKHLLNFGGVVFVFVGLLHLTLGLNADVLLGAAVPPQTIADAVLDSQNRFYGVSFTIYGILLWLFTRDTERYAPMFYCLIAVFFAAGCARLVSIALYGAPSLAVTGLLATELILPPALAITYLRLSKT